MFGSFSLPLQDMIDDGIWWGKLTSASEQSSTILLKTHDLQHTPEGAHGGRTKNQVKGAALGMVHSAL